MDIDSHAAGAGPAAASQEGPAEDARVNLNINKNKYKELQSAVDEGARWDKENQSFYILKSELEFKPRLKPFVVDPSQTSSKTQYIRLRDENGDEISRDELKDLGVTFDKKGMPTAAPGVDLKPLWEKNLVIPENDVITEKVYAVVEKSAEGWRKAYRDGLRPDVGGFHTVKGTDAAAVVDSIPDPSDDGLVKGPIFIHADPDYYTAAISLIKNKVPTSWNSEHQNWTLDIGTRIADYGDWIADSKYTRDDQIKLNLFKVRSKGIDLEDLEEKYNARVKRRSGRIVEAKLTPGHLVPRELRECVHQDTPLGRGEFAVSSGRQSPGERADQGNATSNRQASSTFKDQWKRQKRQGSLSL
jgi:hypothetical protein